MAVVLGLSVAGCGGSFGASRAGLTVSTNGNSLTVIGNNVHGSSSGSAAVVP